MSSFADAQRRHYEQRTQKPMGLAAALRLSDVIRRKDHPKYVGSHGDGWVNIEVMLGENPLIPLTREDIIAEDWEARVS